MSFGLAKDNKFEIIATLREELHKKTKLEVLCENHSVITQLEDWFRAVVISGHEDIVPEKVQYFILHSESGIVKFSARFEQTLSAGAQAGLSYFIPDLIFFAQQRQNQRFFPSWRVTTFSVLVVTKTEKTTLWRLKTSRRAVVH